MEHRLALPLNLYETATSYVSRLTRYCGLSSPTDLCLDLGFRWQDYVRGDDFLFEKIAEIGGASTSDLQRWAIRTTGRHQFEVAGQQATKVSLLRSRVRVCPQCLIEGLQDDGWRGVYRRHFWHFVSVRTCSTHSVPLVTLPSETYTIQNYNFLAVVERNWPHLLRCADRAKSRSSTDLEVYILGRLNGQAQNSFLDNLPMFIATRLCEVLGFVLIFGPERKISSGAEDALSKAGQVGFDALRRGKEGLFEALGSLVSPIATRTIRHQSDFGAFFEWLRLSDLGDGFEGLRDMVRAYIFRTYPFREGDVVLGKPCSSASRYTIHRTWQTLGVQRKRMNRYLIAEGIARKDDGDDEIQLNVSLLPEDIDRISTTITNRLSSFETQSLLRVSGEVLKQFRKSAILVPKTDALDQIPKYDRQDIETLISRLSDRASIRSRSDDETVTIIEAARRVRCPAAQIVQLILDGALRAVFWDKTVPGLAGFEISIAELRCALPPIEMDGVTKGDAARLLRVAYPTINYLIEEGLLMSVRVRNPKSRQFLNAVCSESLKRFQARYETLGCLAKRYRRASGPFGCHLEAKGVCPIDTPKGVSWIYERSGLEARLHKIELRVPARQ